MAEDREQFAERHAKQVELSQSEKKEEALRILQAARKRLEELERRRARRAAKRKSK